MIPRLPKGFSHPVAAGSGAFASVYRVFQSGIDRPAAIKLFFEKDRDRRREKLKEAKIQSQIRLECVPAVYDAFEWRSRVCIVMEWIRGISLDAVLQDGGLSGDERLCLAKRFLEALARLHGLGFAHRDLKPSNIVLTPEGGLYFVDFGFTKNIISGKDSFSSTVKGTPAYMAPEVWEYGSAVDLMRADVYSAGRVLFEILANHPSAAAVKELADTRPQMRPSSGKEALSLWNAAPAAAGADAGCWPGCIAALTARQLADRLVGAAKQLLFAGRSREAYWLLVEAIEENDEHPEALRLMDDFPRFSGKRRLGAAMRYAVAAAAVVVLAAGAFYSGKKSGAGLVDAIANPAAGAGARIAAPDNAGKGAGDLNAEMKEILGHSDKLAGMLVIRQIPGGGALAIDEAVISDKAHLSRGVDLPYGDHVVSWSDDNGVPRWRERVRLLPFQTRAVVVPVPALTDSGKL
ncbi:MAG: serine/threonine protein kinase [Chitinispirillaceae bacterium]|nr:serine/threonine protein kinase [Chitinispirillaceae bacterium]